MSQTQPAFAVSFGRGIFLNPHESLTNIAANEKHPGQIFVKELERSYDATVLIGGRASGVIISETGLVATAFHVIKSFYVSPTDNCSKIPVFLRHEINAEGSSNVGLTRLTCKRLLIANFNSDFALFQVEVPAGMRLPYAEPETDPDAVSVGMGAIIAGHPFAHSFAASVKKISEGPIVLYEPNSPELPHFLHLIDTEGGHSGAPIFSPNGRVIGIHFRGIPYYGQTVTVIIDGTEQKIRRFNVAISMPYLMKKFITEASRQPR